MAKKTKEANTLSGTSDILKLISTFDENSEILDESKSSIIREYLGTGSYILNAAMSGSIFGGVPSGKVVSFAAEAGVGKTFLAVSVCREAQKKGWTPVYLDSENSIDPTFIKRLGCDPKNFIIRQVTTVKEVTTFIINLCKSFEDKGIEFPKIILVLDSIGNLTSDKEFNDSVEGKSARDMTRAQEVKAMFRVITTQLGKLSIPMIVNNHVYASVSSFFPTMEQSSGCLLPEELIITENGIKSIKDIVVGDMVMSHDGKYHLVEKTWNHTKECFKFELEENKEISCSDTHRFLINPENPEEESSWILAKDLKEGDEISIINRIEDAIQKLKITKKQELGLNNVVDLTVQDTHNYVSANGIINHNSGIKFSSSITMMLTAAKLDDKSNDKEASSKKGEFTKNGVLVTAKPVKSRFCIPQKVRFQIPFFTKPNPYVGLEQYMTWENSKVIRGNMLDEKEYLKLTPAEQLKCIKFEDGDFSTWVYPKDSSRQMFCGHLHDTVPIIEFFTDKVFTKEFLKYLDENVIKPAFELPDQSSFEDIKELEDSFGIQTGDGSSEEE